jgi:hypothetical protein
MKEEVQRSETTVKIERNPLQSQRKTTFGVPAACGMDGR